MTLSDVLQPHGPLTSMHYCSITSSQPSRIASFLLFLLLYIATATDACPSACLCSVHVVRCNDKNLDRIPDGIPSNTETLYLLKNNFRNTLLQRSNFTRLRSLKKLYLNHCGIEVISPGTFSDLVELELLDLSDNKIRLIEANTFAGLSLTDLFLNGNGGLELDRNAFGGLSTNGLYLNSCTLDVLPADVLRPLNTSLRRLWLDDNRIERFEPRIEDFFKNLKVLRLGGNPLHCSCDTNWIKIFYDSHRRIFEDQLQPKCASPSKFRDRTFDRIQQYELKCELPKFDEIDVQIESDRGYLKCGAASDPPPVITWVNPGGQKVRFNPPPASKEGESVKNVAILNLDSDARTGTYKCLASNSAGEVTLNMNFVWPKRGPSQTTWPARDTSSPVQSSSTLFSTSTRRGKADATSPRVNGDERLDGMVQTSNRSEMSSSIFDSTYFTLTQFIGAIAGTFLGTLIITIVAMQLIHKRKTRFQASRSSSRTFNGGSYHKPKPNNLYMTNLDEMDFLDLKGSPIRNA